MRKVHILYSDSKNAIAKGNYFALNLYSFICTNKTCTWQPKWVSPNFVHFCTFLICLLQFWDLLMFLFQLKANFSVHQIIIGHFKQYLLCNCILYYIRVVYIFVSWVYIYLNEIYVGLNVEMPEFVSL